MIDSHIHLDDKRFDPDRSLLIQQACEAGLKKFIVPAVTSDSFQRIKTLSETYPEVRAAYGLHPYFLEQHHPSDLDILEEWLDKEPAVALGECGLDYFIKDLDRAQQHFYFEAQIAMAKSLSLPLILHVRAAVEAVFMTLKSKSYFKAVMHSFNGSLQQMKQVLDQGIYCGFGAAVANPKAHKLHELIRYIPLESLLLETDAPDQPFYDKKNQLNKPVDLLRVFATVASLKKISVDKLIEANRHNCDKLFAL